MEKKSQLYALSKYHVYLYATHCAGMRSLLAAGTCRLPYNLGVRGPFLMHIRLGSRIDSSFLIALFLLGRVCKDLLLYIGMCVRIR